MIKLLWRLAAKSPLQHFPVKILAGPAKGMWWTLAPVSGYWRGTVEQDVEETIRSLALPSDPIFWDLGAHFGYFSIVMAAIGGARCHIYSFEPDPRSFQKLKRHIAMNRLHQVTALPYAVGEEAGSLPLIQEEHLSTVSHLPYKNEHISKNAIMVEVVAADSLVANGTVQPPHFIKIDVEGFAGKALKGAQKTIEKFKPTMLISYHSPEEVAESLQVLNPLGYVGTINGKLEETPKEPMTILYFTDK